jgi:uncharacterized protein YfaP (DUF2135 family)
LTRDGSDNTQNTQEVNYIAAPDLDPAEEATNSARIKVSGTTSVDDSTIKLYINGTLEKSMKVNSKNEFTFKDVSIEEGANEIKAKTVAKDGKESGFSSPISITYSSKAPDLTIDYPAEGQTLKQNQQTLRGKTISGADVTVNGFRAIVESNGEFRYDIKLNDGGNSIKIVSTDDAGNKTEKEIHVTYAP